MRTDVTETTGRSGLFRVGAPAGLFLPSGFQPRSQPALNVESAEGVDLAQLAGLNHLTGLTNQRVAGVVVADGEDYARLLHDLGQLLGLGEIESHRLVTNDVETRLGECLGDLEMCVIGRGDGYEIDALIGGQFQLPLDHLTVGTVGAVGWNVVIGG